MNRPAETTNSPVTGEQKPFYFNWLWLILAAVAIATAVGLYPGAQDLAPEGMSAGEFRFVLLLFLLPAAIACVLATFWGDDSDAMKPLRDNVGSTWLAVAVIAGLSAVNGGIVPNGISTILAGLLTVHSLLGVTKSMLHLIGRLRNVEGPRTRASTS